MRPFCEAKKEKGKRGVGPLKTSSKVLPITGWNVGGRLGGQRLLVSIQPLSLPGVRLRLGGKQLRRKRN